VVPHILIQALHLRVAEFEPHLAKDFCNNVGTKRSWRFCHNMSVVGGQSGKHLLAQSISHFDRCCRKRA
jgi:hypothetical protein